jgi:hypothetical protein
MNVLSLGCNCYVGLFLRDHYPGPFYPFDWIWSTLDFVLDTLQTNTFTITSSHMKIVHDTEEESVVREKYNRRLERLYDTLNGKQPVVLIRKTLDRGQDAVVNAPDTAENLNRLLGLLSRFRAPIILCVVDMERCIDRSRLHPAIRLFDSFDSVGFYLQSRKRSSFLRIQQ